MKKIDFEREAVQFCFDKGLNITPYQARTIAEYFYTEGYGDGYGDGYANGSADEKNHVWD